MSKNVLNLNSDETEVVVLGTDCFITEVRPFNELLAPD